MLSRRKTFPAPVPTQLSSLHSANCGLLFTLSLEGPLFFRPSPFKISHLQPLVPKTRGGVPSRPRPSRVGPSQVLYCLLHTCKPSIFMRLRTLLRNGKPITPVFSVACALF